MNLSFFEKIAAHAAHALELFASTGSTEHPAMSVNQLILDTANEAINAAKASANPVVAEAGTIAQSVEAVVEALEPELVAEPEASVSVCEPDALVAPVEPPQAS